MIILSKKELDWLAENATGKMKRFAEVHTGEITGKHSLGIDNGSITVQAGKQRVSVLAPSVWTPNFSDLKEDLGYEPKTI